KTRLPDSRLARNKDDLTLSTLCVFVPLEHDLQVHLPADKARASADMATRSPSYGTNHFVDDDRQLLSLHGVCAHVARQELALDQTRRAFTDRYGTNRRETLD